MVLIQCFHSAGDIGDIMPENQMITYTALVPQVMCANFTITNDTHFEGLHTLTVEIAATSPASPAVVIGDPSITTINITDDDRKCSLYNQILSVCLCLPLYMCVCVC